MSVNQINSQATHDSSRGSGAPETTARWRAFAIALSLAALWFALHQYRGVVHDGRLYVAQALNALFPERFASDLFFRYGSQDSFTIFSPLYKPLIAALGVGSAHYLVTLAGEAAFVSGLAFFVRTLFPDRREALFAFVGAIAVQSGYGGVASFHYDEAFATPRPFAEGLVLAAFSLAFTARPIRAGLALVAAAALHPIMALTGMASLGLWAASRDRRLLILAAAAAVAGVLLGLCSVQPFARLFETFDPEWFDVVRQRCVFALLTRWNIDDYLAVAASLGLAMVCLQWKDRTLRSLAIVFSIASLFALALTFVGGDVGRDVLVINIQSWRAMWLSRLLGNIVLGVLVLRARPDSLSRWPLLIAARSARLLHTCFGRRPHHRGVGSIFHRKQAREPDPLLGPENCSVAVRRRCCLADSICVGVLRKAGRLCGLRLGLRRRGVFRARDRARSKAFIRPRSDRGGRTHARSRVVAQRSTNGVAALSRAARCLGRSG
jgi:hypothetical protein